METPPRLRRAIEEKTRTIEALEEAGHKLEDNSAEAVLLRELVDALSSGKLLLMPTDDV